MNLCMQDIALQKLFPFQLLSALCNESMHLFLALHCSTYEPNEGNQNRTLRFFSGCILPVKGLGSPTNNFCPANFEKIILQRASKCFNYYKI